MMMNLFETKEINFKPRIKLNHNTYSYFEKGCRKKSASDNPER